MRSLRLAKQRGNLEPAGDDVTVHQTPDSTAGNAAWPATRALFLSRRDDKAPEMAGTVPPEDKTLYVAADGTGDFYSIQRALDAAPQTGAMVLVAPGTYREVLTDRQAEHPASQRQSRRKQDSCRQRSQRGRERRHAALSHRECDGRQFLCRKHHLRERLQSNASAAAGGFTGSGAAGHRRPRRLPQCAPAGQPGHGLRGQPQLRSRRRTAFRRGSISPIATLPATSTSSSATARRSLITARFTARP